MSSKHKMLETLTVFDDVFVPWERVFLCREPETRRALALDAFVEYHRFTAVSYKLPLLDALVGTAALIAEMNGVAKAGHIRDKLTRLIIYAETVRALTDMAALRAQRRRPRHRLPRPADHQPRQVHVRHAVPRGVGAGAGLRRRAAGHRSGRRRLGQPRGAGGAREVLRRQGAGRAERLRVINMISDLTARDFGGYHAVLAVHAEGSIEAEKMQILRSYDAGSHNALRPQDRGPELRASSV